MNFKNKPELQERLAAEYALGTLRGAARRRFERWLRGDAALGLAVARWEARLAPMTAGVAPVAPPARIWSAIANRVGGRPATGFWDSLAFWRAVALFTGGTAAALFTVTIFKVPPATLPAPAPIVLRVPASDASVGYVAVLSDPKTEKPVIFVSAARDSDELSIRTLDPSVRVPGKSLELWALSKSGAAKSLGLVSDEEKGELKLVSTAESSLADVPKLAVSLEPRGGSPTGAPTGPVLFTGPCVKYW